MKTAFFKIMIFALMSVSILPVARACSTDELAQSLTQADESFHPADDSPYLVNQGTWLLAKLKECDQQGVIYSDAGDQTHAVIQGIESKLNCKMGQLQQKPQSHYCTSLGY